MERGRHWFMSSQGKSCLSSYPVMGTWMAAMMYNTRERAEWVSHHLAWQMEWHI